MAFWNDLCESIRGNCRECMTTPFTRKKALIIGGIVLVIIIIIIIIAVAVNSANSGSSGQTTGTDIIKSNPLIIGNTRLSEIIKKTYQNKINNLNLDDIMTKAKASTQDLIKGYVATQIWDVGASSCILSQNHDAVSQTLEQIDLINRLFEANKNFTIIKSSSDITEAKKNKKIGAVLRVDGGYALDAKLSMIRTYYNLGVRILALVGTCDNPWGASAWNTSDDADLDAFGKKIIEEMSRLGMIIDISGASKKVQLSIIAEAKAANLPVLLSNSGLKLDPGSPNNVDKDVLTALKEKTGLVTLSLNKDQVCATNALNCTMSDVIDHLDKLKGILGKEASKYIGLGGNFGSEKDNQYPVDLDNPTKFATLLDNLLKPQPTATFKWNTNDLKLMVGENFIQLFANVEKVAADLKTKKKPLEDLIDEGKLPKNVTVALSDKVKSAIIPICYTDFEERYPKK
ncbi:hypothetical protein O3M35_005798 [Rhynocoris fuscipes]|uniref:Dipeptidase n=1 Tax=Rhynocoris fuscipes TaxID=488301 RepID=A0AAW1DPW3_9HEMI